ncbi:DUF805 domain-containing protein [Pseudomonas stutzeri]|uniref:Membrane protein n=1 Tax=Stutzerimonas stutzeri KOS6 TaxID=1218352 RepID=A0A061JTD0_STUST|nr:DUF805 domain-containing protein [Stutzerimonas stutzeri]EWC43016.1 membrane protein [Stutzerimonas stutzeri KOS6]MBK3868733.1 DUF805 domain-containing protein [Stutzerimonas stutzeri]
MQETQFKIVFNGELVSGIALQTVKDNLAALFKTDATKIERLFDGQATVIKSKLDSAEADRYLAALLRAGARAYKTPERPDPPLCLAQTEEEATALAAQTEATPMACPKCGHTQPQSTSCRACGIVIEKYLARQAPPPSGTTPAAAAASPYAPPSAEVGEPMPVHGQLRPFSVTGRIGRLRYLAWSLVAVCAAVGLLGVAAIIMAMSGIAGFVCIGLIGMAWMVVNVQLGVQRLHDFGWSGWLILLNLVPLVGSLFPFVMLLVPGNRDVNRYGSPPPPNSRAVKVLALLWLVLIVAVLVAAPALMDLRPGTR